MATHTLPFCHYPTWAVLLDMCSTMQQVCSVRCYINFLLLITAHQHGEEVKMVRREEEAGGLNKGKYTCRETRESET